MFIGRTISSAVPTAFAVGQLFRRDISKEIRPRVGQTPRRSIAFRKLRMILYDLQHNCNGSTVVCNFFQYKNNNYYIIVVI